MPKYLEKEELALFLKTAREKGIEDDYEFFLTLAYTGLRAGELCALKKTDQDTKLNAIIATKTYYNLRNSITTYELHQKQRHRYNY
ncbi:tyrosine-type recombinase/integrase [Pelosinus fermentans]|uniref:Integrase family protein n=1 Tax=Pelosinus fermentans JBW45 TaxID=1192197 RepID=I8TXQ4_9FIRM|nr:tyrosine-type recombinase/integrase [Pelosinus fermentans]AJQ28338.1 integrase family protein [Pelosinus fermentans JBW45]